MSGPGSPLDRRRFLAGALAAGAAGVLGCGSRKDKAAPSDGAHARTAAGGAPPGKPLSVLMLGGTGFIGPHIVELLGARGHTVTLFNRGKTNPTLFPEIEKLQGDRDGKLEALVGRSWDAVVDTSGYVPRHVAASAALLAPRVKHYVFVSTISVYQGEPTVGMDETAPVTPLTEPGSEDVDQHYGALKALCEQAAEAAMPGRVANIRPGLIVGPRDPTGRFTHWPSRMAQGGEVLGPEDGTTLTQFIDGRDLSAWIVHCLEAGVVGVYNATGPAGRLTFGEMLDACNQAGGNRARVTWVDAGFLEAQGVQPWSDLPCWIPARGDYAGFGTTSNRRAVAAGLTFRPVLETAKDTLAWLASLPADAPARLRSSGISREREAAVLAAWNKQRG